MNRERIFLLLTILLYMAVCAFAIPRVIPWVGETAGWLIYLIYLSVIPIILGMIVAATEQ